MYICGFRGMILKNYLGDLLDVYVVGMSLFQIVLLSFVIVVFLRDYSRGSKFYVNLFFKNRYIGICYQLISFGELEMGYRYCGLFSLLVRNMLGIGFSGII